MTDRDAQRPPEVASEGRADDRRAKQIEHDSTDPLGQCEGTTKVRPLPYLDGYRSGTFNRWCAHRDRATGRCA